MNSNNTFFEKLQLQQSQKWIRAIDSKKIFEWIDDLFFILFPEQVLEQSEIKIRWNRNKIDFENLLIKIGIDKSDAEIKEISDAFYDDIPKIYDFLQKDANAIFNTDPAADCISEIINSYPGFLAIAFYRIANAIASKKIEMLPRIISEYAHSKTGIDIHPNATIDVPFVIRRWCSRW